MTARRATSEQFDVGVLIITQKRARALFEAAVSFPVKLIASAFGPPLDGIARAKDRGIPTAGPLGRPGTQGSQVLIVRGGGRWRMSTDVGV